jgi:putative transposase
MRHRLYYHLIWTTFERSPSLGPAAAAFLCRYVRSVAAEERARVLEIGIVRTHVHLLLTAHPLTNLPRLVQRLKGGSGMLINRHQLGAQAGSFRWADGYDLSTVSHRALDQIRSYVAAQPLHHPNDAIVGWPGARSTPEDLRA